jgi:hypothetical protein
MNHFGNTPASTFPRPLQDLADSKRVNAAVKSVPNNATPLRRRRSLVGIEPLSATILSQLFWPTLPSEEFNLPPQVGLGASLHWSLFVPTRALPVCFPCRLIHDHLIATTIPPSSRCKPC